MISVRPHTCSRRTSPQAWAADGHDFGWGPRGRAEPRPCLHDLASLLEQIAAAVRGLDLVADRVRQRHLGNLVREICALRHPIPKTRSETVRGELTSAHPLEQRQ